MKEQMVINKQDRLAILTKLAYFARGKKVVVAHMIQITEPLTDEKCVLLSMFYTAYFTYFVGLMDYLEEHQFFSHNQLIYFFENKNNYNYIRNLRNNLVHRAEEVSDKLVVQKNILIPRSPKCVANQSGKDVFCSFTDNLLQLVNKCETFNQHLLSFIKNNNLLDYMPFFQCKDDFINEHKNDPYIPEEDKTKILSNIENLWHEYESTQESRKQDNIERILSYFNTDDLRIKAFGVQ